MATPLGGHFQWATDWATGPWLLDLTQFCAETKSWPVLEKILEVLNPVHCICKVCIFVDDLSSVGWAWEKHRGTSRCHGAVNIRVKSQCTWGTHSTLWTLTPGTFVNLRNKACKLKMSKATQAKPTKPLWPLWALVPNTSHANAWLFHRATKCSK